MFSFLNSSSISSRYFRSDVVSKSRRMSDRTDTSVELLGFSALYVFSASILNLLIGEVFALPA